MLEQGLVRAPGQPTPGRYTDARSFNSPENGGEEAAWLWQAHVAISPNTIPKRRWL